MKLTVCYGHVKVIVPCGEGELSVKTLIEKSTARYRKATNKSYLDHVLVTYLQTEDGGILDSDDVVADICDDKDKLIAVFEETIRHRPENSGDSASISSVDSHQDTVTDTFDRIQPVAPPPEFQNEPTDKPPLAVQGALPPRPNGTDKRGSGTWRKERPWRSTESSKTSSLSRGSSSASSTPMSSPDVVKDTPRFTAFDRNLNRKSLSVGHPLLYSWIDAQEKMNENALYSPGFSSDQQGSLEKPFSPGRDSFSNPSTADFDDLDDISSSASEEIELEDNHKIDLGLKVQGYKNAEGKELGLIVHEVRSRNARQSSLNVADRITEVNGVNLRGKSNAEAEAILNQALDKGRVKLKRTRSHHFISKESRKIASSEKQNTLPKIADSVILKSKEAPKPIRRVKEEEIHEAPIEDPQDLKPAPKALTGKKLRIELTKGKNGLGFSITSRDVVVANGPSPVFVKNILANGAAIQDGRLHIGDQILEINDIDVSGKDQSKVLEILKKATGLICLTVNRETNDLEADENEEAMETVSNDSGISAPKDEILMITIPLNNLGPAGLGISVKGKVSSVESCDLGIYIKSIISGGAAAKDGRLKPDDRILRIEDVSLEGMPNDKAMDTMRNTMKSAIKKGAMRIIISRKGRKEFPQANLPVISKPGKQVPTSLKLPSLPTPESNSKQENEFKATGPPIRTKSYFNALQRDLTDYQETKKTSEDKCSLHRKPQAIQNDRASGRKPPTSQSDNRRISGKVVSVSSVEIPITQPSRTVIVDRTPSIEKRKDVTVSNTITTSSVFPPEKSMFFQKKPTTSHPPSYAPEPPSYEETIESRSNSLSDSSSKPSMSKKEEFRLSDTDILRTMSTSSRFSVDSLMLSPDTLPFERDAFGRLSMSERKGRAHLDATKSGFYAKMKKYKSMEDISFNKDTELSSSKKLFGNQGSVDDTDTDIVPLHEAVRRTESLDTMLNNSKISLGQGINEDSQFHRGTATSSSTPWFAQRSVSPTALKLRSRSTAWNDSFRTAVDKTPVFYTKAANNVDKRKPEDLSPESTVPITLTSNANYDTSLKGKKKSGFLKGIGQLLKKGKQRRPSESRDEKYANIEPKRQEPSEEKLLDFPRKQRPRSLNEDTIRSQRIEMNATRLIEREKREKEERLATLQRELENMEKTELMINGTLDQYEAMAAGPQEESVGRDRVVRNSKPDYGMSVQIENRKQTNEEIEGGGLNLRYTRGVTGAVLQTVQRDQRPTQQHGTREIPNVQPPDVSATKNEQPDQRSQQRFLPTSQLFYYGHSSLPRKFTMNNKRKTSATNEKSSAYSIEAQTEIFRRANPNREELDGRNSTRIIRKSPTQVDAGNITISHTAKV